MTLATGEKALVFIVDDDDNILRSLRVALASKYVVKTCNSAVRAVGEIRAAKPEVVVLDIRMPEHDGFWVFREIRKYDNTVPIIFNSAYQDVIPSSDLAGTFAPFGYLPKNGRLQDLLSLLDRAIVG